MAKLDPRLRFLVRSRSRMSGRAAARLGAAPRTRSVVEVLVRMPAGGDPRDLEALGMRVRSAIPGPQPVVSGEISLDKLADLERAVSSRRIEAARQLLPELDLAVPAAKANLLHGAAPPIRGQGALIGIIDSGIDYRHPDFCVPDGSGGLKTRIRYFWDQRGTAVNGGVVPFGREYTSAEIDAAIRGTALPPNIPSADPDPGEDGHGTHVAGVAAGGGKVDAACIGFAPEADLIVVGLNTPLAQTIGRSTDVLQAFDYVIHRAGTDPIAINLSRGMNGGGHSGETVLETALDALGRRPGVAIIKSAGNEHDKNTHAGGTLGAGRRRTLAFDVPVDDRLADIIEVWFDDRDDIGVAITPPTGPQTPVLRGECEFEYTTAHGDTVSISIDTDAADTADTAVTIVISPRSGQAIENGRWKLTLRAGEVKIGRYDAWIERVAGKLGPTEQARFASGVDATRTLTIPGTARSVITVGAYVTRQRQGGRAPGELSESSSHGPTRYGHAKPDLAAPGEMVQAAKVNSQAVTQKRGTSMAAPAVTGVAALILSRRRTLSSYQLRQILTRSARRTGSAAGAGKRDGWGYGKLDAARALDLALNTQFPVISNVKVVGSRISWDTNIPTTGELRFSTDQRHVQLRKKGIALVRSVPASTSHAVDLGTRPAGTYFCEITALGPDRFFTEDDDGGYCHQVEVPA